MSHEKQGPSATYRDVTEPGWREAEAERNRKMADVFAQVPLMRDCAPQAALAAPAAEPEQSTRLRGGVPERAALTALFKDAMDWGRSYGQRLNLSDITLADVSEGYADKALREIYAAAPQAPAPAPGAYDMLNGPPQTLAQIAYYLRKWTPSIESRYTADASAPDIRYVVKLIESIDDQATPAPEQDAGVVRDAWRLLETGDRIESADEVLHDDCVTWGSLVGWEVGATYNTTVFMPIRRKVAAAMSAQGGA